MKLNKFGTSECMPTIAEKNVSQFSNDNDFLFVAKSRDGMKRKKKRKINILSLFLSGDLCAHQ